MRKEMQCESTVGVIRDSSTQVSTKHVAKGQVAHAGGLGHLDLRLKAAAGPLRHRKRANTESFRGEIHYLIFTSNIALAGLF
jgi:hypothetical protein